MNRPMDLRGLQIHLQKSKPAPLYLVYGDETYLVLEAVAAIKRKLLEGSEADFNYDQFFVPEVNGSQIRDVVEMLPMMAPRRLVVVRNTHLLKESDWEVLSPILEQPIDSTSLVLVSDKIDKRKKIFKTIEKSGLSVELKRPFDNQIPMWIDYIARQEGLELDVEAVHTIQQFVGNNLSEIAGEIRKLGQYLGDRKKIVANDVINIVSKSRLQSVFDLANAIGRNDKIHALQCLANLLENGYSEVAAVTMVARHVRILSDLQEYWKQGLRGARLSSQVGVPQFFLNEYIGQAQHWGEGKVRKTMSALFETDRAIKSSPVSSHIWLENLILATCE